MTETLVSFLIELFKGINKNVLVFIVSLFPLIESRGGLIAAALLEVPFTKAFVLCFLGNILPIPFILLLIEKIFVLLKKWSPTKKIINKKQTSITPKSTIVTKKENNIKKSR